MSFAMLFNRAGMTLSISSDKKYYNTMLAGIIKSTSGEFYDDSVVKVSTASITLDAVSLSQYREEPFPAPVVQTVYGLK